MLELNREHNERSDDGKVIYLKSLHRSLSFVGQFTGRDYEDINERLPLSLLRTVKALYQASLGERGHIFEYLKVPNDADSAPTFEFRLSGNTIRNTAKTALVLELLGKLALGIRPDRRSIIDRFILRPANLLPAIDSENQEILKPLKARLAPYPASWPYAYLQLARQIELYRPPTENALRPVHEAIYIRILSLPFLHHVGEFKRTETLAKLDFAPDRAEKELGSMAASLGPGIDPYRIQFIAINDTRSFFDSWATALVKITSVVTRLKINRRDLEDKLDYVEKILHLAVADPYKPLRPGTNRLPPDQVVSEKVLSLADFIAALCVVAHQQKVKTQYEAKFQGKTSQTGKRASLLGQLEQTLSIEDLYEEDYVPEGVHQILLSRMNQFHAYILGVEDLYYAKRAFTVSRLSGYAHCLEATTLEGGQRSVNEFNDHCKNLSEEYSGRVLYGRSTMLHA